MPNVILVGGQFGDEGKGKFSDAFGAEADLVIRYGGGANAGHTIVHGGKRYVLHLVPAGVLSQKRSVIGAGCVVDLEDLLEEIKTLQEAGVAVSKELLWISERAHVVTPYQRMYDRAKGVGIGTTGRGIGPCYADKAKRIGLRLCDLSDWGGGKRRVEDEEHKGGAGGAQGNGDGGSALSRLEEQYHMYSALLSEREDGSQVEGEGRKGGSGGSAGNGVVKLPSPKETWHRLREVYAKIQAYVCDPSEGILEAIKEGKRLLFEGAQGILLDVDQGTYPYVTSSFTGASGAAAGVGVYVEFQRRVLVTKAYTTRVGNGPFPTELFGEEGMYLQSKGQEVGATTGRKRRCGWLDLPALKRAVRLNQATDLALTKLDIFSGMDRFSACVDYKEGQPVYKEFDGFSQELSSLTSFDELHANCKRYIAFIESTLGVPVHFLSTGQKRSELLSKVNLWS